MFAMVSKESKLLVSLQFAELIAEFIASCFGTNNVSAKYKKRH